MLFVPAVESIARQERLSYVSRITRTGPSSLTDMLALLSHNGNNTSYESSQMSSYSWSAAVVDDMALLRQFVAPKLDALGPPDHNSLVWLEFIRMYPIEWKQIVRSYTPSTSTGSAAASTYIAPPASSVVDCVANCPPPVARTGCASHVCIQCVPNLTFKTLRGLDTHTRVVHSAALGLHKYIDGSCKCPVCFKVFESRIQVIRHVYNSKVKHIPDSCRNKLINGSFKPINSCALRPLKLLIGAESRMLGKLANHIPVSLLRLELLP